MYYYNWDMLMLVVGMMLMSIILMSMLNNMLFIMLLFMTMMVNIGLMLMYLNNTFVCSWLMIIYGGAITMFIMLGSSVTKVGFIYENYKSYNLKSMLTILLVDMVGLVYLIIFFFYKMYHMYSLNNYFVWDFMLNCSNFNMSNSYNMENLCVYLFNIYGGVLLSLGVLLLKVMISTMLILFSEKV